MDGNTVFVLKHECESLRGELCALKARFQQEQEAWRVEHERRTGELLQDIKAIQIERAKLKRKIEDQALTIHELTLQEDSSSEDDGDDGGFASECDEAEFTDEYEDQSDVAILGARGASSRSQSRSEDSDDMRRRAVAAPRHDKRSTRHELGWISAHMGRRDNAAASSSPFTSNHINFKV